MYLWVTNVCKTELRLTCEILLLLLLIDSNLSNGTPVQNGRGAPEIKTEDKIKHGKHHSNHSKQCFFPLHACFKYQME